MTKEELDDKIDWEGGIAETITGYGLSPGNLPEDAPPEVKAAWERLYTQARDDIEIIEKWLYDGFEGSGSWPS